MSASAGADDATSLVIECRGAEPMHGRIASTDVLDVDPHWCLVTPGEGQLSVDSAATKWISASYPERVVTRRPMANPTPALIEPTIIT
jgi:hypothetical protein